LRYNNWRLPENEERLRDAALKSKSIAGMCRELGLVPIGGNFHTLKFHITRLEIDTRHHLGQQWNRDNFKGSGYRGNESWKKQLIRTRGYRCERCKLSEWMGQPITLELEHVDGNSSNYNEENLKLLCCNCHAQTPTWRRRKAPYPNSAEESDLSPES
jgi:hypothetical protein